MRRHLIKSTTTVESSRLKQLLTEAELFSYDAMSVARKQQLDCIKKNAKKSLKETRFRVDKDSEEFITVDYETVVLYLVFATLGVTAS